MSISWQSAVDPRPAILVLPPGAASLDEAHAAIELWEHYSRKRLDAAQRLAVEVMMAESSAGKWAAATTGREMPRQNGKGDEVEVVELWGLVQRAEAIMHTVHDAVLLASQAQQRLLAIIEGNPDLRRRKLRQWLGTGQQMIEMRNGGVIWYRTRTGGGGRGVDDIARLVVDEAQHATEEHLAALTPTLFANANPQMNLLGSAGIEGKSELWWATRIRALSPDPGDFGYVGHTAEQVTIDADGFPVQSPVDVEDRALWVSSNPALHAGRGQGFAFFEEQLRRLGPRLFGREHLGVWDPPPDTAGGESWGVITRDEWNACLDPTAAAPLTGLAWAVDAAPDGTAAGIACSDGKTAEVVDHRPGIAWVPARLCELHLTYGCVPRLDDKGPAGALLSALDELGVPWERVTLQEHAQACGGLLEAVRAGAFVHRGQPPLDAAVRVAGRRQVGDVWLWTRRRSGGDISPLVAVTIAKWAAANAYDGPLVAVT